MLPRVTATWRSVVLTRAGPAALPTIMQPDARPTPLVEQEVERVLAMPDGLAPDPNDKTLLFESKFESGNLYLAQKVSDSEYNLLMQNDINTNGHTQWFYFKVKNTKKGQNVKFNIMNFTKPDSLFNYGMKISVYSQKMAERE